MRILLISDGYPLDKEPNIYIFIHRQALALAKNNVEVVVLDIDLRSIRIYREKYNGIDVYRVSFPFITTKFPCLYAVLNKYIACKMYKKIEKEIGNVDIINAHFVQGAGEAAVELKRLYHKPVIITEHSSKIISNKNNAIQYYKKTYLKADTVITVSTALSNKLKQFGINNVMIPNVINTNIFYPTKRENTGSFTFLSIGSLIERKRFDLTIQAFAAIQMKYKNCKLIIVGEGELEKKLRELSEKLHVKNIKFIKMIKNDKLPELYNSVECFVLPSDSETFGMVYAEAIACGIPAIATDNGGALEIINNENGIIIPVGDLKALENAMEVEMNNKKRDSEELHNTIKNKFSENIFVEQYKKVVKNLGNKKE